MNKRDANYLLASLSQHGIIDAISEALEEVNELYVELSGNLRAKLPVQHFNRLYSDLMGVVLRLVFWVEAGENLAWKLINATEVHIRVLS